jgi:putative flavoprotein involved in K+ transport
VERKADGSGFRAETSEGVIEASNVVAATGPFQRPIIPAVVPPDAGIMQVHSNAYRNPGQLPQGAVMVVGAGSSGVQIADELLRAGKRVYLSVGPHDRPPIRYRGRDFCWWLGVLGMWDAKTREPGMEHVTIAVSGAHGGHTVDFRKLAARGITLLGRAGPFKDGVMHCADDLARNIAQGDAHYLSVLDAADAYVAKNGLDLPEEPEARRIDANPDCVTDPILQLNLAEAGITAIVWATGFAVDFGWLKADTFDARGIPLHERGVSKVPGLYFLGLPWLSRRASPFIWGVWHDAEYLAGHIAARR